MAQAHTIIVKLRDGKNAADQSPKIRNLLGSNLVRVVRPLFPGEEELASVFEVILKEHASVERALASLNDAQDVEYAHAPQERRPLRG